MNPSTLKAINAVRILKSMKISFGVDLGFASDCFKGYGTILRCLVCAPCHGVTFTTLRQRHQLQKPFPAFWVVRYPALSCSVACRKNTNTLELLEECHECLLHHNSNEDKDGFCGICIRSKLLGTKHEPKSLVNH